VPYLLPGPDVTRIVDAPPTPLARLAPGGEHLVLVQYESHPPVALLARRYLALAGIRIDPALRARRRQRRLTGLAVIRLADGRQRDLPLPPGAQVSVPTWAPDGRRLAFTVDSGDGVDLWVADAANATAWRVPGLRVNDVLGGDPLTPAAAARWSRDSRSLLVLGAAGGGIALPEPVTEPRIEETAGKRSQMATFQDLLRTDADADAFEALATSVPLRVDPVTGDSAALGPPGLYQRITESPDGRHLLVHQVARPFSFRVPYPLFARSAAVWSTDGTSERVVADLPVSDEVPRQGVPTGPRMVSWAERDPATLIWAEALDGGDPVAPAEHRDRIMVLAAGPGAEPREELRLRHRCQGWVDLDEPGALLITEHDRDRRWDTTWLHRLGGAVPDRVVFDRGSDDDYGDPGWPLQTVHPDGTRTALQDGSAIYLVGRGATASGDRPFLDRFDLSTCQATRLFRSPASCLDQVVGFAEGGRDRVVMWHESPAEPPNLRLVALDGSGFRTLTSWPDPHPQLTGLTRRLVRTDRGDGVTLSGMLYLPPGYAPERDGRLPLVIWAYPLDYGSAETAGQVRGSASRFTRLSGLEPAWFVLRGYAVLADATMPVIGDPETKNDTYIEQITAAARAHVRALAEAGIADPARVAVGGHSYGAFMTANLLAHTDLFAAGIARSGAYNRSLTPFGFQTERRSFWEVPEVYDRVSPFRYADRIAAPLLLIHGEQDNNAGTFPIQSQRLFQALQGSGGTSRLVLLPHESHGYLARESVLHVLAEQFGWLDRWIGGRGEAAAVRAATADQSAAAAEPG
jgi:dipeptidyl aminopeptidase/acylaminoacyl peptidase